MCWPVTESGLGKAEGPAGGACFSGQWIRRAHGGGGGCVSCQHCCLGPPRLAARIRRVRQCPEGRRVSFLSPCGFACLGGPENKNHFQFLSLGQTTRKLCGAGTPPTGSGHWWCACLGTVSPHGTGTEGGHVSQLVHCH